MHAFRLAIPLLTALGLGACAARTEWVKDGSGSAELRQTREACLHEAGGYYFLDGRAATYPEADARDRRLSAGQGDLFRLCMEARGWRRQRVQPAG